MKRAQKVKAVFSILNAANDDFAAVEVLLAAEHLVEIAADSYAGRAAANDPNYDHLFDRWSLDSAFADDGWRILSRRGVDYCPEWDDDELFDPREPLEALGLIGGFRQ